MGTNKRTSDTTKGGSTGTSRAISSVSIQNATTTITIDPTGISGTSGRGAATTTKTKLIISGRVFEINCLDPLLDREFTHLYGSYLGQETMNWSDFEHAVLKFFSDNSGRSLYERHEAYFTNFTKIWNRFLNIGNYDEAERLWDLALSPALSWENSNPGKPIHKGTPYYFWGMTAILRGDIDKGYALMHRAVQEDIMTTGLSAPRTPAFAFIGIDYANLNQAFYPWIHDQELYLTKRQENYSTLYKRLFTLNDFRQKFLASPPDIDTLSLFAYTIARLMKLSSVPRHILQSEFAAQLEANLLFGIVLITDAVIKHKNPEKWKFIDHAKYLSLKAGKGLTIQQLKYINSAYQQQNNFDNTLASILDGSFKLSDGVGLSGIQSDVAVAYGLRNLSAHTVSAISTIHDRFEDVEQAVFNVLFAAVDYLF